MYPFIRMAKEMVVNRKTPVIAVNESHVSSHICWPWDLDPWSELNNGRTLTLFDLGRIPMARRFGLNDAFARRGWRMTIAGASVRYRRRIQVLERIEMRSRVIGWDTRFFYVEQTLWNRRGECTTQALFRAATTSQNGIVPPPDVVTEIGIQGESPTLPDWVQAWIDADAKRSWPPEQV